MIYFAILITCFILFVIGIIFLYLDFFKRISRIIWLVSINIQNNGSIFLEKSKDFFLPLAIIFFVYILIIRFFNTLSLDTTQFSNPGILTIGLFVAIIFSYCQVLELKDPLRDFALYAGESGLKAIMFLVISSACKYIQFSLLSKLSNKAFNLPISENGNFFAFFFSIFSIYYLLISIIPVVTSVLYIISVLNFKLNRRNWTDFMNIEKVFSPKIRWISYQDWKNYNSLSGNKIEEINKNREKKDTEEIKNYYKLGD